ncbi:acyl-CoA dehydrogenase NM domain-like protein [Peniophora sp. CONT]|nr:acyl-CoA dehydrogenase NM domain-like protein [Peniophora sp. CONT]
MFRNSSRPTRDLAKTPLFQLHYEHLPLEKRLQISYKRAQAIGRAYKLTAEDVLQPSPHFWWMHTDPMWGMDGAAATMITLQYNCAAGALAMHANEHPSIRATLDKVLNYDISGVFCLTEVAHGLDAINMETTAVLDKDGTFILNTPHEGAAKFMPSTSPVGLPCSAVVFARTIVDGEDRGVKPFLVDLHNGRDTNRGIVIKLLPQKGGSRALNHSLTYFRHVRLQPHALMGPIDMPDNKRMAFLFNIFRVAVGTLAVSAVAVPTFQICAHIAARYSQRRKVFDSAAPGKQKPIIEFRTQKTPIVTVLAHAYVMCALMDYSSNLFSNADEDPRVRHAIATIGKVTLVSHAQEACFTLSDRLGSQGLFEVNQLNAMFNDLRGVAIGEGDTLVLSIRLASELLLERYAVPETTNPKSLLARHEIGIRDELRATLCTMANHRDAAFDRAILPRSLEFVSAIGQRMAYDAAVDAKVDQCLLDLFVAACMKKDAAFYVEKAGLSRAQQRKMEADAVDIVYERLEEFLAPMDLEPYITAPIISEQKWNEYVRSIKTYGEVSEEPIATTSTRSYVDESPYMQLTASAKL